MKRSAVFIIVMSAIYAPKSLGAKRICRDPAASILITRILGFENDPSLGTQTRRLRNWMVDGIAHLDGKLQDALLDRAERFSDDERAQILHDITAQLTGVANLESTLTRERFVAFVEDSFLNREPNALSQWTPFREMSYGRASPDQVPKMQAAATQLLQEAAYRAKHPASGREPIDVAIISDGLNALMNFPAPESLAIQQALKDLGTTMFAGYNAYQWEYQLACLFHHVRPNQSLTTQSGLLDRLKHEPGSYALLLLGRGISKKTLDLAAVPKGELSILAEAFNRGLTEYQSTKVRKHEPELDRFPNPWVP